MSADEFRSSVSRLEQLLTDQLPRINERMALDCAGMVKDRLVNDGVRADGSKLGKYSDVEIPLFFYKNGKLHAPFSSPLNKGGEALVEKVKKANRLKKNGGQREPGGEIKGISYKQLREAEGRQTDFVDLKMSGETMRDIGPVKQVISGFKVVTHVGSKNTKVRAGGVTTDKVLDGWSKQYGNVLEPNRAEAEVLKKLLQEQVLKLIRESFGH